MDFIVLEGIFYLVEPFRHRERAEQLAIHSFVNHTVASDILES